MFGALWFFFCEISLSFSKTFCLQLFLFAFYDDPPSLFELIKLTSKRTLWWAITKSNFLSFSRHSTRHLTSAEAHSSSKHFGCTHLHADHLGIPGLTSGLFVFLGMTFGGSMSVVGFRFGKSFRNFWLWQYRPPSSVSTM
jgi:hypothetical protein